LTFGKGFGDLPDSLEWLRPFAIAREFPINGRTLTQYAVAKCNDIAAVCS
jgi:hypothetical protein